MQTELWLGIIIASIGTYGLRVIPLMWTQRHLKKHQCTNNETTLPLWISVLGPLMIAAMLGVSLVPKVTTIESWIGTGVGVLVTITVWRKTRSLGLPVLLGVLAFGIVFLIV